MEETFVRLYTRKPNYSGKSAFKTWLYAIGRNTAREYLNRLSKKRTVSFSDSIEVSDDYYNPEISFFREERYLTLHKMMPKLKPEYYQVLWLFYFEEMSAKDIASVMKKSRNNVNVLLHRAKQSLKNEMKKEGWCDENL